MKWYIQQRSSRVNVRGFEILVAARKLAVQLGIENFTGSDRWLWQFRNRHGLFSTTVRGEAANADDVSVEPFRHKLQAIIEEEGLSLSQVYNGDESSIYWRAMPRNSQLRKGEEKTRSKKSS